MLSLIKESTLDSIAIYSDEEIFLEIIEIIFDISCIEIPKYFMEIEKFEGENETIQKFISNKDNILRKIIYELSSTNEKEPNSCSVECFLKKFEGDRLVKNNFFYFFSL